MIPTPPLTKPSTTKTKKNQSSSKLATTFKNKTQTPHYKNLQKFKTPI